MSTRLELRSTSLPDLLQAFSRFHVPSHQRVYGWGLVPVSRLLADCGIKAGDDGTVRFRRDDGAWLFLGPVYLSKRSDGDGHDVDVADGQQRIVTLTILYSVARDLEQEPERKRALAQLIELGNGAGSGENQYRLVPRAIDAEFFRRWVQDAGATLKPFKRSTVGVADKDVNAVGEDPGSDDGDLDDSTSELSDSQRNIIANRDLIVEQLRGLSTQDRRDFLAHVAERSEVVVVVAPNIEDARAAYASTYKRGLRQAEVDMVKSELVGGADPAIRDSLAMHWDKAEADLGKEAFEDLLETLVVIHSNSRTSLDLQSALMTTFRLPERVQTFVEGTLSPYAQCYRRLLDASVLAGGALSGTLQRGRIKRINGHLISLLRAGPTEWMAPALFGLRTLQGSLEQLELLLAGLERMVAAHIIVGVDPHQASETYQAVIAGLRAGPREAQQALELPVSLVNEAVKKLASEKFGLKSRCRGMVLLKLNDIAAGQPIKVGAKFATVEHVLPKNPSGKSRWRVTFRDPKSGHYNGGRYLNRLGNLTLLSPKENVEVQNHEFEVKKRTFSGSFFKLSNVASRQRDWNIPTVEQRGAEMLADLRKAWNF